MPIHTGTADATLADMSEVFPVTRWRFSG